MRSQCWCQHQWGRTVHTSTWQLQTRPRLRPSASTTRYKPQRFKQCVYQEPSCRSSFAWCIWWVGIWWYWWWPCFEQVCRVAEGMTWGLTSSTQTRSAVLSIAQSRPCCWTSSPVAHWLTSWRFQLRHRRVCKVRSCWQGLQTRRVLTYRSRPASRTFQDFRRTAHQWSWWGCGARWHGWYRFLTWGYHSTNNWWSWKPRSHSHSTPW